MGARSGVSQRRLGMRFLENFPKGGHSTCIVKQGSAGQCIWRAAKSSVRPEERRAGQAARNEAAEVSRAKSQKILGTNLRSWNLTLKAMGRKKTGSVARDSMGGGKSH